MPYQLMTAWSAHRDIVKLVMLRRRLEGAGRRFHPVGEWEVVTDRSIAPGEDPVRTSGLVPVGSLVSAPVGDATAAGEDPEHTAGREASGYLPIPVQSGMAALVPDPTVWVGQLVQYWQGETRVPLRQSLDVLRLDERRVVVVQASREIDPAAYSDPVAAADRLAGSTWDVVQVLYSIDGASGPAVRR